MLICALTVACALVIWTSTHIPHSAMDDFMRQTSLKHIFCGVLAIQMHWLMQSVAADIWRTHTSVTSQLHHIP